MAYPIALPAIAGLAVVGALGGVWLGKSAVSEINPAYFNAPETRFHSDLVPNRSPDWAEVQSAELQQASLGEDYGRFCLGCIDYPEDPHPVRVHQADGWADGWSASASYEEPEVYTASAATVPVEQADPEWQRVQLYSRSRVSADEPEQAPVQAAEPADEPNEGELQPSGM